MFKIIFYDKTDYRTVSLPQPSLPFFILAKMHITSHLYHYFPYKSWCCRIFLTLCYEFSCE